MRKSQKKEILEMTATLYEAHEEVKNSIQSGNYVQAQGLLAQCQECAIGIGNVIEKSEGEGFVTVHYIEEYCDALFGAYDELGGADGINGSKIYEGLKKHLLKMENSVRNDITEKKEIVFFPYKASMWDSLESLWMEVKDRDDCEVYVIPIPYYDKNPDGSVKQWHYEGKDYPNNVPITDWEKYDVESRKPDEAYIHNPYDEFNLVTSVHSRFYSSELKKHVGKLIYAPYFVSGGSVGEHFVKTPGVVNADTVIVQSEEIREKYISVYVDFMCGQAAVGKGAGKAERELMRRIKKTAEGKFIVKKSPKLERVERAMSEEITLPDEWRRLITDRDGNPKKTIFYNTTIDALLKNSSGYMAKLRSVLEVFRQTEGIVLWWRPHPLLQSTIDSMIPQLSAAYREIVERYKREGWGIFDDTPDVTRAVVATDAYYGDASSVVEMYKVTGKPIMIQNVEITDY